MEAVPCRLGVIFDRLSRFCLPAHFRFALDNGLEDELIDIAIPAGLRLAIVP
jgi:hypothetical protein